MSEELINFDEFPPEKWEEMKAHLHSCAECMKNYLLDQEKWQKGEKTLCDELKEIVEAILREPDTSGLTQTDLLNKAREMFHERRKE
jgi:replicative DNA helicase